MKILSFRCTSLGLDAGYQQENTKWTLMEKSYFAVVEFFLFASRSLRALIALAFTATLF
jgi:hypothetical protein